MSTPTTSVDAPVKDIASDTATTSTSTNNITSDPATLNPGVVCSTQDVGMTDETEDITSANPASNLGKRKAGVRARENISAAAGVKDDDIYALEFSDDEKPSKKRVKATNASKTAPPPSKAPRRGPKGIFIGTHTLDPQGRLPVYAVYYPNGPLNCRVFYEDCSKAVQDEFNDFFRSKAQAKMDVIKLDENIFANIPKVQTLSADEKKQCIKDLLATKGIYPPSKNDADSTSEVKVKDSAASKVPAPSSKVATSNASNSVPSNQASSSSITAIKGSASTSTKIATTTQASLKSIAPKKVASSSASASAPKSRPSSSKGKTPAPLNGASGPSSSAVSAAITHHAKQVIVDYSSDLRVGFWKINGAIYVYAFLVNNLSRGKVDVGFRMHFAQVPEELRALPDFLPASEALTYDEIDFEDEYNLESEEFTKSYIKTFLQAKDAEKKQKAIDDSDDGDDADIPAVAPVVPNPRQKSSRIADKKGEQKRNQRGALGQLAKSTQEEEGVNDNEVEIRDAVAANNITAQGSDATGPSAPSAKGKGKENAQSTAFKDNLIRQLKAHNKDQNATIAELEKTIRQLNHSHTNEKSRVRTKVLGKRIIGTKAYDILGTGPNSGKLLTPHWKKVFSNKKWYKEWIALSEIKLNMGNIGEMVEVEQLGDLTFFKVPNGTHEGLLVETVSEKSIFEAPEGKFIRWTIREELPKEGSLL